MSLCDVGWNIYDMRVRRRVFFFRRDYLVKRVLGFCFGD